MGVGGAVAMVEVVVVVVVVVGEADDVEVILDVEAKVEVDVAILAVAVDVEMVVALGDSMLSPSQDSPGNQCSHVTGFVGESQYSDFHMNHAPIVVEHLLD